MSAMKRRITAILATVPFVAVGVIGTAAAANATQDPPGGDHKVAFCHATHSETNPYVYIETDNIAVVRAHFKHQDHEDVWPAFTYSWKGQIVSYAGSDNDAFIERGCVSAPEG
ncbi:hypothetical protein SAMN05428970_3798 [Agromyces sp. CF514]|uniref:hypothetical protein n=1 Tax=Agromyces sp. CF514 TaxID=1881031 RepID=UPI0008EBBB3C|nr:hypothetical protein [Agromyces sp. CF514]SFR91445.1 hypothetical protein SAMN05428970_3798 [Agromyces sp. CF514]